MHHQFGREIAVNNEIDIHLQLCFYALIIGKEVEGRFHYDLSEGAPFPIQTHGTTQFAERILALFYTIIAHIDQIGVAIERIHYFVRTRRDIDIQSFNWFIINTDTPRKPHWCEEGRSQLILILAPVIH